MGRRALSLSPRRMKASVVPSQSAAPIQLTPTTDLISREPHDGRPSSEGGLARQTGAALRRTLLHFL